MEDDADDDAADGRSQPGPSTACEGTAVPHAIPKPYTVKPAKTGALLTLRMGDLLAGLTDGVTSNVEEDVAMEKKEHVAGAEEHAGKESGDCAIGEDNPGARGKK
ncbi:hypothetical protein EV702DRAFT_1192951 [Suillus placidus]|uniref:Uncharacterized protein n=1 Tax=Suillus placidus TaxID=48579 RepID=A0A9P7A390_9AGAM|nr:hypothetical protein EV702DRAFT_1192951 [Suillus placidus]